MPVYARGANVREWLYVADCARAIFLVLEKGKLGEVYNIGSGQERKNIDIVKAILGLLGKPQKLIEFVKDRPGHDFRYAIDFAKLNAELGWRPKHSFEAGLLATVKWYIDNHAWWQPLLAAHDASARRGLAKVDA